MERSTASNSFVREVRLALHRLYDPAELGRSPLVRLLGVKPQEDPSAGLRRVLLEAIAALRPAAKVSPQAPTWRTYHILSQRYAEQYSQSEVAATLALSERQLRRHQGAAVRALASYLWTRFDIQSALGQTAGGEPAVASAVGDGAPTRQEEMAWLQRSLPSEPSSVGDLVRAVLNTASPLLKEAGVRLEVTVPENLPDAVIQQTPVRQALLGVLTAASRYAPGGKVSLTAERQSVTVRLSIRAEAPRRVPPALGDEDADSLAIARQLLALSGAQLAVELAAGAQRPFAVHIGLPAAEQVRVLVVDDNADALALVERYLAGTRYRFVAASDPRDALTAAAEQPPDVIVLDVMLPGVDGWDVLGHLREHPRTREVPVIVCTILPHERLALALGAAAFLRKPISRQALLATLAQQMEALAKGRE